MHDDDRADFAQAFVWPVQGRVSGRFGNQRVYNGEPGAAHSGMDIAAANGTPVAAPAAGVVTFVGPDLYLTGGTVLLEAGTGIGKSFAYLVPALAWGRANKERTIVSTNTINLQEQLVGKDLPLLREALAEGDHRPTYALLKGWRNYLCLSRLQTAMGSQHSLLEPEKLEELISLSEWATRTSDGTRAGSHLLG